jgi:undecaprenyl-diphosphatase
LIAGAGFVTQAKRFLSQFGTSLPKSTIQRLGLITTTQKNQALVSEWDLSLMFLINREWTHPFLDWLMPAVSAINCWTPVIVASVLLVIWRQRKYGLLLVGCLGLSVLVSDCVISYSLKKIVTRPRPTDSVLGVKVRSLAKTKPEFMRLFLGSIERDSVLKVPPIGPTPPHLGKSFPSSHTMNMFAVATVLAFYHRRLGWWMYGLAALVAYSRVYVGSHWPSDIPPSIGLGLLVGLGVSVLMRHLSRRWLAV